MSNDDRFRPQDNQPDPNQGGQYYAPQNSDGAGSPHTGEGQNLQWSGQSPHTGQSPQWQNQYSQNQVPQNQGEMPQQGSQNFQQNPGTQQDQGFQQTQNFQSQDPQGGQFGSSQSPHTGQGQNLNWSGQSAQTGEYSQGGGWPQQVPPQGAGGAGGPGGPGQNWGQGNYQGGQPPKKRRSTAIIAILLVLVLVLVGLGIWWWMGRSSQAEAADGAANPTEAATTLVERVNSGEFTTIYESMSPSEKQYSSALLSILMSYSWEAMSEGTDTDTEDAQEALTEALDRYSEVIDYNMEIGSMEEVSLTTGMTGVAITDGSITVEITDVHEFSVITADVVQEMYSEDQLAAMFGVTDGDELVAQIEQAITEADGAGPHSVDFTELEPLILVMVEEEKGWYVSPISSAVAYVRPDYFTDSDARQSFIQRNGEFTMTTPTPSSSPEEAAERFTKALSDESITDALGYLPLAEQRGLGLGIYLAEAPQIQEITFGDLVRLSNIVTTTVEISDHSALTIFDEVLIDFNPALTGSALQIELANEQLTVGTCEPIDASLLLDPDSPVLAFATVHDESGWNVSLFGTLLNAAGAVSTDTTNMAEYENLMNQLNTCLG